MPEPTFDLQSHSTHSDGELAPRDVVAAAAQAGVRLLALTDHDTVAGVDEALDAAVEHGLVVVPAVELSCVDDAAADIHVLGYGIDHRAPGMLDALDRFREDRLGRADRMAAKLRALGLELDEEALDRRRATGGTVGRPHLAEAVLSAPENAGRLREEGLETVTDVIVAYLIEDRPAFAGRTMPRIDEAIALIHEHGGVAVWAHPFWDVEEPDAVRATFERYVAAGVDGIEAFYVTHDEEQTRFAAGLAQERGLLRTGSADFHGPGHRLFSRFLAFSLHDLEPELGSIGVL